MFYKKILLGTAVSVLALGGIAAAQEATGYYNIGYTSISGDDVTIGSIVARGGFHFSPHFGVEGEISHGVNEDDVTIGTQNVDVSANFGFGAFLTGRYPLTENGSDVFARIGYQSIEIDGESGGVSASGDLDGIAYGVGTNFMFGGQNGVRLDYTRIDGDDEDADTYSIAYVRRF